MMNRNERQEEQHEDLRVEEPRRIPTLEYAQPSLDGSRPSIVRPTIRVNQFEIKPAIIQMIQNTVQFGGNALDDPNTHIADILEICDTFKFNRISDDAVRLCLFPFSLCYKAKYWLNFLPVGSITTWEDMAKAFLLKYFPPSKTMKLGADIIIFSQFEQESLYEAWERYKDLLRRCPHHELPLGVVVQTFYYGLISSNRTMIDTAACGNLLRKTSEEGYELLDEMVASRYHPQSERNNQRRSARVHQVITFLPSAEDDPWKSKGFYSRVSDSMHSAFFEHLELILSGIVQQGQFIYITDVDLSYALPVLRGLKQIPK